MKFFEDIRVGESSDIGRHTFTAEEIKAFAARFDPQPFHLDEAAGARSQFGALCASGWHTACVWMRLMIKYRRREDRSAARAARRSPNSGRRPVFAISNGSSRSVPATRSRTRPRWSRCGL
jgi:acyl dehydratase